MQCQKDFSKKIFLALPTFFESNYPGSSLGIIGNKKVVVPKDFSRKIFCLYHFFIPNYSQGAALVIGLEKSRQFSRKSFWQPPLFLRPFPRELPGNWSTKK